MKKEQIKGSLQLLSAFATQRVGMDHIGPIPFQTARSLLSVAALTGFTSLVEEANGQHLPCWTDKQLRKAGILC